MIESQDNKLIFDNDFFSYENEPCTCGIDTINVEPGVVTYTLKIQSRKDEKVYFAFGGTTGLCRTTVTGSIKEENLLSMLSSIPDNRIDEVLHFFEDNGFLLKVSSESFEAIDMQDMLAVLNHIKATVFLMSDLENPDPDYEQILRLTLYLLLSEPISINTSVLKNAYSTCKHGFMLAMEKASSLPEIDGQKEAFTKDTYSIKDTIFKTFELNIDEYNDIVSGELTNQRYCGILDARYKNLVYLYRNGSSLPRNQRIIVDFLFHYMKNIGVVCAADYSTGVSYYDENPKHSNFDSALKKALLSVAKIVVGEEINYNLLGITPRYSVQQMGPTWKVPNLLSALYFSVFYLKPGSEVYRKCANPACNNRFLVKTTNTRKIYCSPNCRNATAQRNHRKKVKKQRTRRTEQL